MLKPANVFLARVEDEEVVKILDFGIAKEMNGPPAEVTHTDVLMGSPQYMSPEQARGARDIDHRADLWSFGAILFRAVAGVPAFEGSTAVDVIVRICAGPPPLPSRVLPGLPPEVDDFFRKALDRDPARRFADAREMADAFAALARRGGDVPFETAPSPRPAEEPRDAVRTQVTVRLPYAPTPPHLISTLPPPRLVSTLPPPRLASTLPPRVISTLPPPPAGGEEDIDAFVDRAFSALVALEAPDVPVRLDEAASSVVPPTPRSPQADPPARGGPPESTVPVLRRLGVVRRRGGAAVAVESGVHPDPDARSGARWLVTQPPAASGALRRGAVAVLIDQGFTALRRGETDTARRAWQEALGLDPHNRMLALNLRRLDAMGRRGGGGE
ncbi:MAG: protein kinase [Minicystis sp.]